MKHFLFLLLIPLCIGQISAQSVVNLSIEILDQKRQKIPGAEVELAETKTGEKLKVKSNDLGQATFTLDHGEEWQLFVKGAMMRNKIVMPENGSVNRKMVITYNPEMEKRFSEQSFDRSKIIWTEQTTDKNTKPGKGMAVVKLKIESREGIHQRNKAAAFVNVQENLGYRATSDMLGIAYFLVPVGKKYDIDVENKLNANFVDIKNQEGMVITSTVQYEPAGHKEERRGDSIFQVVKNHEPASTHAYYKVKVTKSGTETGAGERVYLHEIHGKDIIVAETEALGEASFMLPIGKKYMIHFDYQRDVDVIDISDARGFVTGHIQVRYVPDPRLEHPELFIPDAKNLFLTDFENFITKQYPKPSTGNVQMFLKWGNDKINEHSKEAVLEIGMSAIGKGSASPVNICFVLDISGSMAGYYRIERLKSALQTLIDRMNTEDIISIVSFESKMAVVLEPQKIGTDKTKIKALIEALHPGGGTNMLEAMQKGYQFVGKNPQIKNKRIILLTDGYDENEPAVLVNAQKPYNDKIECTAIGVGEGYNYALLKQLASEGRGLLHFVGDSNNFEKVFQDEFMSIYHPVATDVTVEVEYNNKIIFKHLHGLKPKNAVSNPAIYQTSNLYDGANRLALAKFDLVKPDPSLEEQPVIVRLKFFNEVTGKKEVLEQKSWLKWEAYTGKYELITDAEQKKLFCVAEMNRAIKLMSEYYTEDKNKEAQEILETTLVRIREIYPEAKDEDINQLLQSMDQYLAAFRNLARKKSSR